MAPNGSLSTTNDGPNSFLYLVLTLENYPAWAMNMRVNMRAQGVWDAVAGPTDLKGKIDPKGKVVDVDVKVNQIVLAVWH